MVLKAKKPIQINANYRRTEKLLESGEIDIPMDEGNYVTEEEFESAMEDKQDVLTAGDNITIEDGVISAMSSGTEFPKLVYRYVGTSAYVTGIEPTTEAFDTIYIPDMDPKHGYPVVGVDDTFWDGFDTTVQSRLAKIRFPCFLEALINILYNCTGLAVVDIHDTKITSIPISFLAGTKSNVFRTVELPLTCYFINNYGFSNNDKIVTVNLEHVTYIGDSAFSGCSKLAQVRFGSYIQTIGRSAFNGCSAPTDYLELPPGNYTTHYSFAGWSGLKKVVFKEGFVGAGNNLFANCTGLVLVDVNSDRLSIGEQMFSGCTSLQKINLKNVTTIRRLAFYQCTALTEVTGMENVTYFDNGCFRFCPLTSAKFSGSTTTLSYQAFSDNSSVTRVEFGVGFNPTTLDASWCGWRFYDSDGTTEISKTNAVALAGHTFVGTASALVKQ